MNVFLFYFIFLVFYAEIQDGHQKWQENIFWVKLPVDSGDTLWVKNFINITLSCIASEINVFLCLTEIQDDHQKCREKSPADSENTLWVKYFIKITLSRSVCKTNAFLCLMQKFKMATKSGGKTIFVKSG